MRPPGRPRRHSSPERGTVGSMAVQADPATRERSAPTPGHGEERAAGKPLPLENGDRLSRAEFERRYSARPDLKKAELIEGVVYMPSPVRAISHAEPHAAILGWLVTYCASTPGVRAVDNATVRLDLDNEPQPDALLRIVPAAGGRTIMTRRRLYRRRAGTGRGDRCQQRRDRPARQAACLSAQRSAGVPGVAGVGTADRLVRAYRRRVPAVGRDRGRHARQPRISRPATGG